MDRRFAGLATPIHYGCAPDIGPERATRTLTGIEPDPYVSARLELEKELGHPFRQVVVNAYTQPMNLYLHNDKPDLWGAVAIISLGNNARFVLVPAADTFYGDTKVDGRPGWEIVFEHGDVIYLDEPANRYWYHGGIMPADRYSLVLRERDTLTL